MDWYGYPRMVPLVERGGVALASRQCSPNFILPYICSRRYTGEMPVPPARGAATVVLAVVLAVLAAGVFVEIQALLEATA